jgi:hypothetical protein
MVIGDATQALGRNEKVLFLTPGTKLPSGHSRTAKHPNDDRNCLKFHYLVEIYKFYPDAKFYLMWLSYAVVVFEFAVVSETEPFRSTQETGSVSLAQPDCGALRAIN